MREIRICCNPMTSDILVEDPPNSKKYVGYFRQPAELYAFFYNDPEGIHLRERKKLHVIVDLEEMKNSEVRSELEKRIDDIKWNKANVEYMYDRHAYR
jgi:hypothetical protein